MNTKQSNHKRVTLKQAMAAILMTGMLFSAQGAQNISAAEAEQINAELAPVANPEANAEKVGSVPEDPAAVVGTRFTYQGTLRLGNDRAQGPYDFRFKLYDQATGGTQLQGTNMANNLPVTDGLFSITLDFGQTPINGDDIFLEIQVRDGTSTGSYTILSPRQRINATPYAVRALTGGDAGGSSPWVVNGSVISYTAGNVAIGTASSSVRLMVKSTAQQTAVFDTGNNGYISFWEEGQARGYIGSFQTATGTTDKDFEIGTSIPNSTGKMHIVTQGAPRITVLPSGRVGIGPASPSARLHVTSSGTDDPLRVSVNSQAKLRVGNDGTTHFGGDIQQGLAQNGALKAAAFVLRCGDESISLDTYVWRQFNTVNNGTITAATVSGEVGTCDITFPFDLSDRFWLAQPELDTFFPFNDSKKRVAACTKKGNFNQLRCKVWQTNNGTLRDGSNLIVLVY